MLAAISFIMRCWLIAHSFHEKHLTTFYYNIATFIQRVGLISSTSKIDENGFHS